MTKYNEMKQELEDWSRIITFLKVYYQTLNTETIEQHLVQALRTKPAMTKEDVKEEPVVFYNHMLDDVSIWDTRKNGLVVGDIDIIYNTDTMQILFYDVYCEDEDSTIEAEIIRFKQKEDSKEWYHYYADGFLQKRVEDGNASPLKVKDFGAIILKLQTLTIK